MRQRSQSASGFSIIEVMITIVIMGIMVAAAVIEMQPSIQQFHANAAMNMVLGELRSARQMSIAERRDIEVQFIAPNEIKLIREEVTGGTTVLSNIFLSPTVDYMLFPGLPDTPDGFGKQFPVDFGGVNYGPPLMKFQSDGTFINAAGTQISGTVFIGVSGIPTTARAITLLGATGQVRTYRSAGTSWVQQ